MCSAPALYTITRARAAASHELSGRARDMHRWGDQFTKSDRSGVSIYIGALYVEGHFFIGDRMQNFFGFEFGYYTFVFLFIYKTKFLCSTFARAKKALLISVNLLITMMALLNQFQTDQNRARPNRYFESITSRLDFREFALLSRAFPARTKTTSLSLSLSAAN